MNVVDPFLMRRADYSGNATHIVNIENNRTPGRIVLMTFNIAGDEDGISAPGLINYLRRELKIDSQFCDYISPGYNKVGAGISFFKYHCKVFKRGAIGRYGYFKAAHIFRGILF